MSEHMTREGLIWEILKHFGQDSLDNKEEYLNLVNDTAQAVDGARKNTRISSANDAPPAPPHAAQLGRAGAGDWMGR
ncbi:hypothetical protein NKW55_07665 [Gluconobacter kondonii]|uniref:hypothetical protein n=1 Tax=Gluconobacter kondonii TaxID=941463 RepID=UPI0020A1FBA7|nr:hypothetical protein [Gluconobacter kondonii]MCP1236484.1 hypothetical protein [Gluconobacter kondonii]